MRNMPFICPYPRGRWSSFTLLPRPLNDRRSGRRKEQQLSFGTMDPSAKKGLLWILITWAFLILQTYVRCDDNLAAQFGEKGRVLELDDTNFNAAIATFDHILVDFYAPWCGHCQKLAPELDAAAPVLAQSDKPIVLAKVNADKLSRLASKYEVSAYPTLKLFINGFPTDYSGPRKAELLIPYLKKFIAPDVTILKSDSEIQGFIKAAGKSFPIFIGFGVQESLIASLGKKYKNRAWFSVVEDFTDGAMTEYDFDKKPALLVFHPDYSEKDVFYGPFDGEFLSEFIRQSLLPLCVPIRHETLKLLQDDERPIVLTIMKSELEEESSQLIKMLRAAASGNRDLVFAYVGTEQWNDFAGTFNVKKQTKLPIIIVWNGDLEYYSVVGSETLNGENIGSEITRFLEGYREGRTIKHSVKGPSFTDFLNSFISIKTVYIIAFVVIILMLMKSISRSESDETLDRVKLTEVRLAEQRHGDDAHELGTGKTESREPETGFKED